MALRITLTVIGLGLGLLGSRQAYAYLHAEIAALSADQAARSDLAVLAQDAALRALNRRPLSYPNLERAALAEERLRRPQHALRYWQQAVATRPSWPYAWAQVARWELRHGQAPQRLANALAGSARAGDNERGLWKLFAILALQHSDDELAPAARVFLDARLDREIRAQPTHILGYALVHRHEQTLCRAWARTGPENFWCGAARYARPICDAPTPKTRQQNEWCTNLYRMWQSFDYPAG